jgi:hypothetical protein
MRRGSMPSASRLLFAVSVGAKCRAARRVVDHAVHLFGKWLREVAGAQSGFHMAHRHMLVEGRQGARERGGGIALHEQHVRLLGLDYRFEGCQDARRDLRERLPGLHQVQVVIRVLLRRLPALDRASRDAARSRRRAPRNAVALPQVQEHRTELDGFGPGAEDEEDLTHGPPLRNA